LAFFVDDRVRLIDVTSSSLNSLELSSLARLVILTQVNCDGTSVARANCSTVANIDYVNIVIQGHYEIGAGSTFTVIYFLGLLKFFILAVYVLVIGFMTSFYDC
jgi:hypothetical protein